MLKLLVEAKLEWLLWLSMANTAKKIRASVNFAVNFVNKYVHGSKT